MNKRPPKLPFQLLHWFCDPDIVDDIEGDLRERYERYYQYRKLSKYLIVRDILFLFRPGIIRFSGRDEKVSWVAVLRFFLKVGWRNTRSANSFSIFNILGLSLALSGSFLIYQYVQQEYKTDAFFSQKEQLYRVVRNVTEADASYRTPLLAAPFKDWLLNSQGLEENALARIYQEDELVTCDNHSFFEKQFFYADPTFFRLLDYPFLYGDIKSSLSTPNAVVISYDMSLKYFGDANPVGRIFEIDQKGLLEVSGVLAPTPHQSHLNLHFVAPISAMGYSSKLLIEREAHAFAYYVLTVFPPKSARLPDLEGNQNIDWQPMSNIYFDQDLTADMAVHGNKNLIKSLTFIALVLLMMAATNFLNLALCDFLKRIKSLGVRKAIGSNTILEVLKQLVETYLAIGIATLMAFIIAFSMAETILKPFIHSFSLDFSFWLFLPAVGLTLALPYTLYTLTIISGTSASQAIARKVSNIKIKTLQEGVLSFQFVVVIVMMVMSLLIYRQFTFMQERKLGLNPEQVLYFNSNNKHSFRNASKILEEVKALTGVEEVAMSTGGLPHSHAEATRFNIQGVDAERLLTTIFCSANFPALMELSLLNGSMFNPSLRSRTDHTAILNETAAQQLGWPEQNLIGKKINRLDLLGADEHDSRIIIGIVKDFHVKSLQQTIEPMILLRSNQEESFVLKVSKTNAMHLVDQIAKIWESHVPKYPFTYHFLEEKFVRMHDEATQQRKVLYIFLGLTMAIALFGTIGMSGYMLVTRRKEIALRTVLGAPVMGLSLTLFSGYAKILLIATLISLPLSIFFSTLWLYEFSYRIEFTTDLFISSVGAITIIIVGVLAIQMRKALKLNLSNELSDE